MANFPDTPTWVEVKELDNTDKILGITATGEYGASNVPHSQQTQRTAYLKSTLETNYYTKSDINILISKIISPGRIMYTLDLTPPPFFWWMLGYWFLKSAYPELWTSVQNSTPDMIIESPDTLSFQIIDTTELFFRSVSDTNVGRIQQDSMRNIIGSYSGNYSASGKFGGFYELPKSVGITVATGAITNIDDNNLDGTINTLANNFKLNISKSPIVDKTGSMIESGTLGDKGYIDIENRPKNLGLKAIICIGREVDLSNPPSSTPL